MRVRKITNVSENETGVELENGNKVFLKPGQAVEDVGLREISNNRSLKVEYDLSEVPVNEGRQRLYG